MATVSKSKLALRFDIKIPPQSIYYPSIGYFVANTTKKKGWVGQHSRNVLRPSSLELATSLLGASRLRREKLLAFRELFGAKALYFKRAQPKLLPRQHSQDLLARNLLELTTSLPDAFSIQSGEIVSFPQVLCWLALYFILNFFWNKFLKVARSKLL